jgi:hypothetical protein
MIPRQRRLCAPRSARRRAKSTEIRDAYAEKPLFEREGSVRLFGVRLLDFYEIALTRSTSEVPSRRLARFGLRIAPDREVAANLREGNLREGTGPPCSL